MPENREAKDELRLKQCIDLMRAVVTTFGEPLLLDALAIVCETPDAPRLLSAAAEFSRAIQEEQGPQLSGNPGLFNDSDIPKSST